MLMFTAMIIVIAETTGTSMAIGELVDQKITPGILTDTFRSNGLSTMLGGILQQLCYTMPSCRIPALFALTGIKSRYVVACSGVILNTRAFLPRLVAVIAALPPSVLGGLAIIMFGMTLIMGIRQLARVQYEETRNTIIVAVSLGVGILPMSFPTLFPGIEGSFRVIIESWGRLAVILNALLNGVTSKENTPKETDIASKGGAAKVDSAALTAVQRIKIHKDLSPGGLCNVSDRYNGNMSGQDHLFW